MGTPQAQELMTVMPFLMRPRRRARPGAERVPVPGRDAPAGAIAGHEWPIAPDGARRYFLV
jgi:hypothetical protein